MKTEVFNFADASITLYMFMFFLVISAVAFVYFDLKNWQKQIDKKQNDYKGPINLNSKDNEKR